MRRCSLLLVLTLLSPPSAGAQSARLLPRAASPDAAGFSSARLTRIDSLIQPLVVHREIPGAVALIARRGEVAYLKAWGYRDVETQVPLRPDDIFRIASQSKAVTALAVMMLWEEGRFLLDQPLSQWMPAFAKPRVLTAFHATDTTWESEPARREITIRHLLTHTSGLDYPAIGSEEFRAIYAKTGVPSGIGNDRDRLAEKMAILGALPLKHQPGERFTYGLGSDVLGRLVEVVSGQSFDVFLRTRIFEPLGMRDTWFYLPPERQERLVTLHDGESGTVVPMRDSAYDGVDPNYPRLRGTYFSGGAGLSSTAEDYARFLQLFLNGGELDGVRLLSRKTVEMMLTDQLPGMDVEFGLGFGLETPANDHRSPVSVGTFSWGGAFTTTYWADPQEELIGVLYTNIYNTAHGDLGERFQVLVYQALAD